MSGRGRKRGFTDRVKIALFVMLILPFPISVKGETPLPPQVQQPADQPSPLPPLLEARPEMPPPTAPPSTLEPTNPVQPTAPILFQLKEFRVEGNNLILQEKIDALLAPFTGDQKGFTDIEKVRVELEKAYHDAGYPTVLVIVPEQTLENGVVKMEVIESRLDQIEITGNRHFSKSYILKKLPGLKLHAVLYEPDVEQQLAVLNSNPDLFVTPVMSVGDEPGKVNLQLNVQDRLPLHGYIEWNDKETPNTLRYRLEASVQYANLFGRDQILAFNTTQTPEILGNIQVYGLNYVVPLKSPDTLLTFYGTYSNNISAIPASTLQSTTQTTTQITGSEIRFIGSSTLFGVRYGFPFLPGGRWTHQLSLSFEYKEIGRTSVLFPDPLGSDLVSNPVNYSPVSIAYNGTSSSSVGSIKLNGSVKFNKSNWIWQGGVDDFSGNHQSQVLADGSPNPDYLPGNRAGATGNFALIQAGSEFYGILPKQMAISLKVNGQLASEPLISLEEFFAGGVDSVRGYLENEVLGDNGIRGSVEYYFPPLPRFLLVSERELVRFRGFLDAAHVTIKGTPVGQTDHFSIASYGIGLDVRLGDYFQTTLDQGWALEEGVVTRRTNPYLHFAMKVQF